MARPTKGKRVCCLPERQIFGPLYGPIDEQTTIVMSVEEYETIRLIDLEGMMQETCAEQMQVARTTVQRIYGEARKKIAAALVNGQVLRIEGGHYELCPEGRVQRGCGRCRRQLFTTFDQVNIVKDE